MVDYSSYKIEIFPNINDIPVAPTATEAGNGSHLIDKFNTLIDTLESDENDAQERLEDLETVVYDSNSSNVDPSYKTTLDLNSSVIDVFNINKVCKLSAILLENIDEYNTFPFLNGNPLNYGVPQTSQGITTFPIQPPTQLSVNDIIAFQSNAGDQLNVTITLIFS